MSRDRELAPGHRFEDTSVRVRRRAINPVLELQQAIGNQAVGQMLARKGPGSKKTPAVKTNPTVKIGKHTIDVAGGNIAAWAVAGDAPDKLEVTSQKGGHSAVLKRLFEKQTRIESLTLTVAAANKSGELDLGSFAIDIANGLIGSYDVDGKTETWQVVGFTGVHRTKTTHTVK